MTVRQQRDVGHHFMINKLVAFGGSYHAVQRHHAAKSGVSKMIKSPGDRFFHDTERCSYGKVLTKLVVQRFMPHRISAIG